MLQKDDHDWVGLLEETDEMRFCCAAMLLRLAQGKPGEEQFQFLGQTFQVEAAPDLCSVCIYPAGS